MAMLGIGELFLLPVIWLIAFGGAGVPLGVPPLPADPVLSNVAPDECLWYVSWAGTAEPDATSDNHTERLLAEPELRELLALAEREIRKAARSAADGEGKDAEALRQLPMLAKTWLTRPTAAFIENIAFTEKGPQPTGGMIVNTGTQTRQVVSALKLLEAMLTDDAVIETYDEGGVTWHRVPTPRGAPNFAWASNDTHVMLAFGEGAAKGIMQRTATAPPAWLIKLKADLPVERTSMVSRLDVAGLLKIIENQGQDQTVGRIIAATGLHNVTAVENVSGLDQQGVVSRSRLAISGKPDGLLALLAGPPLVANDLRSVPRDSMIAASLRLDAADAYHTLLDAVGQVEPRGRAEIEREIGRIEEQLGINLLRDLLEPLGDVWTIYNVPGGAMFGGITAVVKVDEAGRLADTQSKLVALVRAMHMLEGGRRPRHHFAVSVREFEYRKRTVHFLNFYGAISPVAPAWCLDGDRLIVGLFPQTLKTFLAREAAAASLADAPPITATLAEQPGPIGLVYHDSAAMFRGAYPLLQIGAHMGFSEMQRAGINIDISALPTADTIARHLQPGVTSLRQTDAGFELVQRQTLPAMGGPVGLVPLLALVTLRAMPLPRLASRQNASMNNLKQIGLAIHSHDATHEILPRAYSVDDDGKPLLSWRVRILPYLEQPRLYDQFHVDEPWDSPHNRKLIQKMPPVFRAPGSRAATEFRTNYLTLRGPDTMFPGKNQIRIADVRDGLSNTIMVVEASDEKAVIWTKPDDLTYNSDRPLGGLVGLRQGGFLALFGDGSVRKIEATVDKKILNALFTRSDGEVVEY